MKQGPEIQRKNNFIINTGDNLTAEEREFKIRQNKKKYGLKPEEIKELKLPKSRNGQKSEVVLTVEQIFHPKSNFSKIEKLHHLSNLRSAIKQKLMKIQNKKIAKIRLAQKYKPLGQCIVLKKHMDDEYSFEDVV